MNKIFTTFAFLFLLFTRDVAYPAESINPAGTSEKYSILKLIKTIEITPDENYKTGGFCRVNYIKSLNKFIVTFGTGTYGNPGENTNPIPQGQIYKEYDTEMNYTGSHGYFFHGGGDSACTVVDDYYYFLTGGPKGMRLIKYDPATWREVKRIEADIDRGAGENTGDQMLCYVNGVLDASGLFAPVKKPDPYRGESTWHRFYSKDLELIERKILSDTPHINGSSMFFLNDIYYFVSSTAFFGDLIVMKYDKYWKYLGKKTLVADGQWPQQTIYDPSRDFFYIAYDDNSMRGSVNARLGIFDREWNLLETIHVTEFRPEDRKNAGRPSVTQYGNRLYFSYDVDTNTNGQTNFDWQAIVKIYEFVDLSSRQIDEI